MHNKENLVYFNLPNEADKWIWRIKNGVINWVENNNKSFWYIVLWESKRMGVLNKDVTRSEFATLIFQECKDSLPGKYTKETIFHNIEKFKYKDNLREFDKQPDSSIVREYVNEVSILLTATIPISSTNEDFVLALRMEYYLYKYTTNESYTKIIRNPIYDGKTTTLAFEKYVSKKFWDENRPSHRILFECINDSLTVEKVEALHGRFSSMDNTKIFVVSTHAFSGQVKHEAERCHIGLILISPNHEINEDSFVLPRTPGNQKAEEVQWHKMLKGTNDMTKPILVYDSGRIDDSLSFALYKFGACNKDNLFVAAPVLSDEEIEAVAFSYVQPQADMYAAELSHYTSNDKVPVCEIDPYSIAKELGLTLKRGKTGRSTGHIDIGHKSVTLSNKVDADSTNGRFFMAHEIGHNHFHRQVSEKAKDGVHSVVSYNKRWLEHHANYFASCLLMPANVISLLYSIYWKKEFHGANAVPIRVKEDYYNDPVFQRVVGPVARKMKVSLQAAYIRLKKMGLIIDAM